MTESTSAGPATVHGGGVHVLWWPLGLEVAEAAWSARFGMGNAMYSALWTTQELLEMAGVAALILALLDYLALSRASITLRFAGGRGGD